MIFIVKHLDLDIDIPCPTEANATKLFDKITNAGGNAEVFFVTAEGEVGELERISRPRKSQPLIQVV